MTSEFVKKLIEDSESDVNLVDIDVNPVVVREALAEISNVAALGPDGISAMILKKGGDRIVIELVKLLEVSVENGKFPEELKGPWICPIWKGDSRALLVNYRPVSLVRNVSKVMGKFVRRHMVKFLEDSGLVDINQHGALNGRSTLTQLLA